MTPPNNKPTDERFNEFIDKAFAAKTPAQEQEFELWFSAQPDRQELDAQLGQLLKPTDTEIQQKKREMGNQVRERIRLREAAKLKDQPPTTPPTNVQPQS